MKITYILTAFSTAMFGEKATIHMKNISEAEAVALVGPETKIMSTRISHEKLARRCLPAATGEVVRFAQMSDGVNAIHVHYRGPMIPESGEIPFNGVVTYYLIETEAYQE